MPCPTCPFPKVPCLFLLVRITKRGSRSALRCIRVPPSRCLDPTASLGSTCESGLRRFFWRGSTSVGRWLRGAACGNEWDWVETRDQWRLQMKHTVRGCGKCQPEPGQRQRWKGKMVMESRAGETETRHVRGDAFWGWARRKAVFPSCWSDICPSESSGFLPKVRHYQHWRHPPSLCHPVWGHQPHVATEQVKSIRNKLLYEWKIHTGFWRPLTKIECKVFINILCMLYIEIIFWLCQV